MRQRLLKLHLVFSALIFAITVAMWSTYTPADDVVLMYAVGPLVLIAELVALTYAVLLTGRLAGRRTHEVALVAFLAAAAFIPVVGAVAYLVAALAFFAASPAMRGPRGGSE
jgi:hypothetical protein